MKIWQSDSARFDMRERLERVLGRVDAGNGTPLAAALSSALEVDLRLQDREDGSDLLRRLTDDQILDLAAKLAEALDGDGRGFDLPLGSRVRPCFSGGVRIDEEVWALDADAPGLHPEESIPASAGGVNLELLRRELTRLVRERPWRAIGLPSPHSVADGGIQHFLEFPPFAPAGGVVVQWLVGPHKWALFRSTLAHEITTLAQVLAGFMEMVWDRRTEIASRVAAADSGLAEAAALTGLPTRAVAVRQMLGSEPPDMWVEFDGTDDTLRPGVVTAVIPRQSEPPSLLRRPSTAMRDEAERLAALGADGTIDEIARGAIQAAPEGPAVVLARLTRELQTVVTFPIGSSLLHVTVRWNRGCLRGELSLPGTINQEGQTVVVAGSELPQTVLAGLEMPRLDELIELPFPCAARVVSAENFPDALRLRLETDRWLVNAKTGGMWPAERS